MEYEEVLSSGDGPTPVILPCLLHQRAHCADLLIGLCPLIQRPLTPLAALQSKAIGRLREITDEAGTPFTVKADLGSVMRLQSCVGGGRQAVR